MELHRIASRRACLLGAAWGSAWLLAACAAPPAPPPAPAPSRDEQLRALGFRPTDEGWELSIAGRSKTVAGVGGPRALAVSGSLGGGAGRGEGRRGLRR